jgi:hypothetical protein
VNPRREMDRGVRDTCDPPFGTNVPHTLVKKIIFEFYSEFLKL